MHSDGDWLLPDRCQTGTQGRKKGSGPRPIRKWQEAGQTRPVGNQGNFKMTILKKLWNDESGASAAEYALILAIVGTGIAVAAYGLGTSISGAMNNASDCIDEAAGGTGCAVAAAG